MNKSSNINKILSLIFISILLVAILFFTIILLKKPKNYTDLPYCKEICRKLEKLDFDQFNCVNINNNDSQHVQFYFNLKDYNKYSKKECMIDILNVRDTITSYLKSNPDSELNSKLIICVFETFPGDLTYMYNYNFKEDITLQQPEELLYFKNLYADFSYSQSFSDARIIELEVNANDDITLFLEWKNLEYLNIIGNCLTEEKQKYLCEILPNCKIAYNWETFYTPATPKTD